MLKNIFIIILILTSTFYKSQNLEDLERVTEDYIDKAKYREAIYFNIENLLKFKGSKNKEGIVMVYINIAKLFCVLNDYKESSKYFEEAKTNIKNVKNPLLAGKLYLEYGIYYSRLDLDTEANKNFNKAIQYFIKAEDSEKKQHYLFSCYISKWGYFEYIKQKDSSLAIQKKCLKEYPKEAMVYNLITYRYIYSDTNVDSVKYYLDKSNSLSPKGYSKGLVLLYTGEYYTLQDDFQKALDYYFEALIVFKQLNRKVSMLDVYKRIKLTYSYLKNKEKDDEYAIIYERLEKEIRNDKINSAGYAIQRLVDEQEEEDRSKRNKLYIIILSITILFSAMIYFLRKIYLKKQKKKDELLEKKDELLEKKDKTLNRKSIETQNLKKRINASFDKLVELAKSGDPFFLTKFKEVYPDFYKKLIADHPDLTELEIKFCAYLRLNLNNKEILQYENVTIRTLETRRYRLKKKLGLSADVDLAKWMMEL